jgi:hypothetical protein
MNSSPWCKQLTEWSFMRKVRFLNIVLLPLIALVLSAGRSIFAAPLHQSTVITFSGYQWMVKEGTGLGPGPNNWSANNVWVDANGDLHLQSLYRHTDANENEFSRWLFTTHEPLQDIPQMPAPVRMNLWLFQGKEPLNKQSVEVVIHQFRFIPATPAQ